MSGLTRAASGDTLDLSGANITYVVVVAAIALVALGFAVALRSSVLATGQGTEKMQGIAAAVQEGASAFLTRQFKTLAAFAVLALVLLSLLPADTAGIRIGRSVYFVIGAGFSSLIASACSVISVQTASALRPPRSSWRSTRLGSWDSSAWS